eukprot:scaffold275_cov301-Prasinococcus_capsulatus_cf.AAC.2
MLHAHVPEELARRKRRPKSGSAAQEALNSLHPPTCAQGLRLVAQRAGERHWRRLTVWGAMLPLTGALGILPIPGTALLFGWNLFRTYCHHRAYHGSRLLLDASAAATRDPPPPPPPPPQEQQQEGDGAGAAWPGTASGDGDGEGEDVDGVGFMCVRACPREERTLLTRGRVPACGFCCCGCGSCLRGQLPAERGAGASGAGGGALAERAERGADPRRGAHRAHARLRARRGAGAPPHPQAGGAPRAPRVTPPRAAPAWTAAVQRWARSPPPTLPPILSAGAALHTRLPPFAFRSSLLHPSTRSSIHCASQPGVACVVLGAPRSTGYVPHDAPDPDTCVRIRSIDAISRSALADTGRGGHVRGHIRRARGVPCCRARGGHPQRQARLDSRALPSDAPH